MKDNSWINYGKNDPYFAVLTDEKFKKKNLSGENLDDFFQSGEQHVEAVLEFLKSSFAVEPAKIRRVLDFGCGTGRLVIPFAKRFEQVVGVDISQGMLDEARKNLNVRGITNVELLQTFDFPGLQFKECFDFVHTYIVLQHIPLKTGYQIIDKLLSIVCEGGHGMLHITFASEQAEWKKKAFILKNSNAVTRGIFNLVKGLPINAPYMQMNQYSLKTIFKQFIAHEVKKVALNYTNHGGYIGANLYFQK